MSVSMSISPISLTSAFERISAEVDALFETLLASPGDARARLYDAMRHAAVGGGKRMRPLLLVSVAELFGVDRHAAVRAGGAVEAIHVYSLIHDDLPAMDDDDLRRGKPTVHKAYDDATAVLAGDSLHALAFEILASEALHPDPFVRIELVRILSEASGPSGMAGGQMMDLEAGKGAYDLPTVTRLQQLKTGALISASVEMGAVLGRASDEVRVGLRGYARDIGLAFQIADDLIDVEGDEQKAGKALRKDDSQGKETFVTLLGPKRAREQARLLTEQAIGHLRGFGAEAELLRALARFIIERDR